MDNSGDSDDVVFNLVNYLKSQKISPEECRKLRSIQLLQQIDFAADVQDFPRGPHEKKQFSLAVYFLFGLLTLSVVSIPGHPFQVPLKKLIGILNVNEFFTTRECLLRSPEKFGEMFRPPVDCSFCRNLRQVDILDGVSPADFTAKYAYSSLPLVIRGATRNWTATATLSFQFIRELYLTEYPGSLDVLEEHCQFFPYKTEFKSLREVLSMPDDRFRQTWYVGWSNCDVSVASILRRLYSPPSFLPMGSQSGRFDWIFMGTPGYGAHMHVDHVGKPSWQAQILGSKLWKLEPPRECYFACNAMEVTVGPGDIIVLDTDTWYHSTKILGDEISITIGSEYD